MPALSATDEAYTPWDAETTTTSMLPAAVVPVAVAARLEPPPRADARFATYAIGRYASVMTPLLAWAATVSVLPSVAVTSAGASSSRQ